MSIPAHNMEEALCIVQEKCTGPSWQNNLFHTVKRSLLDRAPDLKHQTALPFEWNKSAVHKVGAQF